MNLLYPFGTENIIDLNTDTYQNLAIEELIDMIAITKEEQDIVRKVFKKLPIDTQTSLYRQEILKDILSSEEFCNELGIILKKLDVLKEYNSHNHFHTVKRACLLDLVDYMSEMDIYIQVVEELNSLFAKYPMSSTGLCEMAKLLKEVIDLDQITKLKEIVATLKTDVSTLKSVTVGINLDTELHPEEIRILQYSTIPFPSQFYGASLGFNFTTQRMNRYVETSHVMKYICDDMERHLSKSVQKYKSELKKYVNFKGYFLLDICNDLKFYLMIAKFGRKLMDYGSGLSFPSLDCNKESVNITGVYNIRLVAKNVKEIIKNDFSFNTNEKVFILTGPNRGGKTMLTQAVGIAAFMAGQGLFVAADSYDGFLFNGIFTHFPADENKTLDLGRLGEEAIRIQKIAKEANNKSLVLLNETYSSTSAVDGLYMAKDLVHILKHKGIPTIFNTHLHDLTRMTKEMNNWDGEGDVISLSMEIVNNQNTYRVLRKEPDSSSFAHNIALKYGVTYEQMLEQ